MQKEIRKRKKRFWVVCLAAVLLMQGVMPSLTAMAVGYNADSDPKFYSGYDITASGFNTADTIALNSGDTITFEAILAASPNIWLYDDDGALLKQITPTDMGLSSTIPMCSYTYPLPTYENATAAVTAAISAGQFKEWQVTYIYKSGGKLSRLKIKAVPYVEHSITYDVDTTKGTNPSGNPSTFREGVGATIDPATANPGYRFEGWYTTGTTAGVYDVLMNTIPADRTTDVTLQARFALADYNITYNLNGGSNDGTNPSDYTYGTGVTGFANPTRDGYTFGGWYDSAAYTTQITSISATNTGDVGLWAKWEEIVEDEDDEDDEPETVATPQPAVKDAVPKTGDTAGAAVPGLLAGGAVTALGLLALGKRRSRRA